MTKWKVVAAIAATLLLCYWIHADGVYRGKLEGQLEVKDLTGQLEKTRNDAQAAKQEHQRQLAAETDRMNHEHAQAMDEVQRNAAVSHAESDGLRNQLASLQDRLRRQQSADSGAGFQLAPGIRAAMVLSDLYASCSRERSELAIAFDTAHARGLAVEKRYDMIRGQ